MLLCFLLQNLDKAKGKLLSAAALEVRIIKSLCGVRQNQQQGILRRQIGGYIRALTANCDSPGTVNDFIVRVRCVGCALGKARD